MNPGKITRDLLASTVTALLLLTGALTAAHAAKPVGGSIEGIVSKVHDGDSLWLSAPDRQPIVVRLRDIDAPEICQIHGEEARVALAELALNRKAILKPEGRDEYGRTLGVVSVDGVDLGLRMVEEGHAWSIRTKWDIGPLVKQERMAQSLGRGLWAHGGAVKPAEFRRAYGPCGGAELAASPPPKPAARTAAAPAPAPSSSHLPHVAPAAAPLGNNYRCDGRTYCSQMRSCDEARYFLSHCPGTKMDGDGNGVPCEAQWCGRR